MVPAAGVRVVKGTLACRGVTGRVSVLVTGGICVCASGAAACSLGQAGDGGLWWLLLEAGWKQPGRLVVSASCLSVCLWSTR